MNGFKDVNGDIRYDKVLEWTLPTFGENNDVKLFDWQAARMRNYMIFIIRHKGYTPRYYDPAKGKVVLAHHVAR